MLIIDIEGRPWWCPELEATDPKSIREKEVELSGQDWKEYQGPWNINPGAGND